MQVLLMLSCLFRKRINHQKYLGRDLGPHPVVRDDKGLLMLRTPQTTTSKDWRCVYRGCLGEERMTLKGEAESNILCAWRNIIMTQECSCSRLLPIGAEPFVRWLEKFFKIWTPWGDLQASRWRQAQVLSSCRAQDVTCLPLPKPLPACLAFSRRQHHQHLWEQLLQWRCQAILCSFKSFPRWCHRVN